MFRDHATPPSQRRDVKRPSTVDRARQAARLLRSEGMPGVSARLRKRAVGKLVQPGDTPLPVRRSDLARAGEIAAHGWALPDPLPLRSDGRLTVAWVTVPPSETSGGHATMFRIVEALAGAGHRCVVYLDDQHGWSIEQHRRYIRSWLPSVEAEIRDLAGGIDDAHAIVATSWQTAYPVLASPARGARCYLVADFEPLFYPAGSQAMLAEATYRFGFHGVTLGCWLSEMLARDYNMPADHFDFACDLATYGLEPSHESGARSGICYYCRPSTPRRAYELAMVTLDLFAAQHPDVDIHLFGESAGRRSFRAIDHGFLKPRELSTLYNRCAAGLVLSATNVSLVPHEMLACGCIPVVNDAEHNRVVLDNPHVRYASATPFELAAALSQLVTRPSGERRHTAEAAAASVSGTSWIDAGMEVEGIIRRVVEARCAAQV